MQRPYLDFLKQSASLHVFSGVQDSSCTKSVLFHILKFKKATADFSLGKILLTIVQKLEQFLSSTSAEVGIFRSKIILEVYTRSHFIDHSLTLFYFVQISVVIPDPFPRIRQK